MTTIELARRGALAEELDYPDDGCSLSPSCLRCPLPACRFDVPGGVQALRRDETAAAVRELRRQGLSALAIAARVGVTRRTVFRHLASRGGAS